MTLENLIKEMEITTKEALESEPDSIKKLVNGYIPTGAGVGKQYFSTLVFALTYTLTLGEHVLYHILDCIDNTEMPLEIIKELVCIFLNRGFKSTSFLGYVLDPNVEKYAQDLLNLLDSVKSKQELRAVLGAYFTYINAMHWWLHVRFPWGLGVAFPKRGTLC